MFYELKRGRAGWITFQELQDDYVMYEFPEQTVRECRGNPYNFRSNPYVVDGMVFAVLDIINLLDVSGEKARVALYIRRDLCLFVNVKDESGDVQKLFDHVIRRYEAKGEGLKQIEPERLLYHFLEQLIQGDTKFLENMEVNMSGLETRILKEPIDPVFINEILTVKKELMYIRNYYEQLIDLGEVLRDNEDDIFSEENVKRFAFFTARSQRLSESVKHLEEYTVQLRETHDAMMDYNLNSIMKLLTVITTVFLPLTLIVGWYGMNFTGMPELGWRYGYPCVIVCSVLVIVFCIAAFKKHKLL